MQDSVDGECCGGGEKESQREREVIKANVNLGDSRSREVCCGSQNSSQKRDYDGDLGKLGPKTKETELRLGLPVELERKEGLDDKGSRQGPSTRTSDASHGKTSGFSMEGFCGSVVDSTYMDTGLEGFRGSVGKGGSLGRHNLHGQFFTGEVGGLEPHGRGLASQNQDEHMQKTSFQEFTGRELPFDIRFSQQERWGKAMMVMPPLNSHFRTAGSEDRRASSSGGKRIFSDTLHGRPNVTPQLDPPKVAYPHSQLRMPHPTFMFPFAGGPNMWDPPQNTANLGSFGGHMGANLKPALTPEMRIEPSSSQLPQHLPAGLPTLASSENKSSQAQSEGARNEDGEQSGPRTAPVVGWPPIRSFRKNLASQPKVAPVPAPAPAAPAPAPAPGPPVAAAPVSGPPVAAGQQKKLRTMFVKVNVEGVPIGRKIDLKAYDSYEKLYVALDEMFRGSIPGQKPGENNEPSVLRGRDFVLVYEDDEGDRMLVGDVPWEMFVSTVKRLRVIKSSEARGLANRQLTKTAQ